VEFDHDEGAGTLKAVISRRDSVTLLFEALTAKAFPVGETTTQRRENNPGPPARTDRPRSCPARHTGQPHRPRRHPHDLITSTADHHAEMRIRQNRVQGLLRERDDVVEIATKAVLGSVSALRDLTPEPQRNDIHFGRVRPRRVRLDVLHFREVFLQRVQEILLRPP